MRRIPICLVAALAATRTSDAFSPVSSLMRVPFSSLVESSFVRPHSTVSAAMRFIEDYTTQWMEQKPNSEDFQHDSMGPTTMRMHQQHQQLGHVQRQGRNNNNFFNQVSWNGNHNNNNARDQQSQLWSPRAFAPDTTQTSYGMPETHSQQRWTPRRAPQMGPPPQWQQPESGPRNLKVWNGDVEHTRNDVQQQLQSNAYHEHWGEIQTPLSRPRGATQNTRQGGNWWDIFTGGRNGYNNMNNIQLNRNRQAPSPYAPQAQHYNNNINGAGNDRQSTFSPRGRQQQNVSTAGLFGSTQQLRNNNGNTYINRISQGQNDGNYNNRNARRWNNGNAYNNNSSSRNGQRWNNGNAYNNSNRNSYSPSPFAQQQTTRLVAASASSLPTTQRSQAWQPDQAFEEKVVTPELRPNPSWKPGQQTAIPPKPITRMRQPGQQQAWIPDPVFDEKAVTREMRQRPSWQGNPREGRNKRNSLFSIFSSTPNPSQRTNTFGTGPARRNNSFSSFRGSPITQKSTPQVWQPDQASVEKPSASPLRPKVTWQSDDDFSAASAQPGQRRLRLWVPLESSDLNGMGMNNSMNGNSVLPGPVLPSNNNKKNGWNPSRERRRVSWGSASSRPKPVANTATVYNPPNPGLKRWAPPTQPTSFTSANQRAWGRNQFGRMSSSSFRRQQPSSMPSYTYKWPGDEVNYGRNKSFGLASGLAVSVALAASLPYWQPILERKLAETPGKIPQDARKLMSSDYSLEKLGAKLGMKPGSSPQEAIMAPFKKLEKKNAENSVKSFAASPEGAVKAAPKPSESTSKATINPPENTAKTVENTVKSVNAPPPPGPVLPTPPKPETANVQMSVLTPKPETASSQTTEAKKDGATAKVEQPKAASQTTEAKRDSAPTKVEQPKPPTPPVVQQGAPSSTKPTTEVKKDSPAATVQTPKPDAPKVANQSSGDMKKAPEKPVEGHNQQPGGPGFL